MVEAVIVGVGYKERTIRDEGKEGKENGREEGKRRETYHRLVASVFGNCTYHVGARTREGETHLDRKSVV